MNKANITGGDGRDVELEHEVHTFASNVTQAGAIEISEHRYGDCVRTITVAPGEWVAAEVDNSAVSGARRYTLP